MYMIRNATVNSAHVGAGREEKVKQAAFGKENLKVKE